MNKSKYMTIALAALLALAMPTSCKRNQMQGNLKNRMVPLGKRIHLATDYPVNQIPPHFTRLSKVIIPTLMPL